MENIKVEKQGDKYWVVLTGSAQNIVYEGITKKSCLKYIAKEKKTEMRSSQRSISS